MSDSASGHPRVTAVILAWNNFEDTAECVRSVLTMDPPGASVLVVDNHSSDRTAERLRAAFPQINVLENPDNLGYAGGNNAGIRHALAEGADHVLILNNDIVVAPNMLTELLAEALRRNDGSALLAPLVCYHDRPGVINAAGTSIDWFRLRPVVGLCGKPRELAPDRPYNRPVLVGCALLASRATLEKIGLLDEAYFLVHEDADWCLRNLSAGGVNRVVPAAIAYHKNSVTLSKHALMTHYYSTRNILYLARHRADFAQKLMAMAGAFLFVVQNAARLPLGGARARRARAFFAGLADFLMGRMGRSPRRWLS